jgi:hypothetical protein
VLNGHVFQPTNLVAGPFTTTSFATYMILAVGTTDASTTIGDQTFSGSMEYAGVGGYASYEHAFLEHFSARLWMSDLVFSGTSGRSIVVIGTEVAAGFGAGATASLKLSDALRLGLLVDVSFTPNLALTIGEALGDVIDSCSAPAGCDVDSGTAISIQKATTVQPSVALAWAPFAPLGITANVAYVHLEPNDTDSSSAADGMQLSSAVDFDLGPAVGVPLGLQAAVAWTFPTGSSESLQHLTDVGLGFYYTGRPDLAVGLQLLARRFQIVEAARTDWSAYLLTIGLRYYF